MGRSLLNGGWANHHAPQLDKTRRKRSASEELKQVAKCPHGCRIVAELLGSTLSLKIEEGKKSRSKKPNLGDNLDTDNKSLPAGRQSRSAVEAGGAVPNQGHGRQFSTCFSLRHGLEIAPQFERIVESVS